MTRKVKVGVIGCGPRSFGSTIKNIRNIAAYDLVAICDYYPALMDKVSAAYPDLKARHYTDHHEMLANPEIEAVFVVVEPENNARLVCDSLNAGKHTYCDVPLSFSLEGCWSVVEAVERTGLKFMMGEQIRYSPRIQAWRRMVKEGRLGKILYAQGEYLHGMGPDRYYLDQTSGARVHFREAQQRGDCIKSRLWNMTHPICYLPHELSPLLRVLDDRVTRVSCVGTRRTSYIHDWLPLPDLEVALMQTENDVIMRMAVGFTVDTMKKADKDTHWHHIMGTQGVVEQGRNPALSGGQYYCEGEFMSPEKPAQIAWDYNPLFTGREVLDSGHNGMDFWPYKDFSAWLTDPEFDASEICDVYRACEITAPGILAGMSADRNGDWLDLPDFRKKRRVSGVGEV